ncbi:MAG TPA: hypothetical protein VH092_36780 [Urbifossiella sp.]|nr:hypothetical protein [Urbifossiella sp.]
MVRLPPFSCDDHDGWIRSLLSDVGHYRDYVLEMLAAAERLLAGECENWSGSSDAYHVELLPDGAVLTMDGIGQSVVPLAVFSARLAAFLGL